MSRFDGWARLAALGAAGCAIGLFVDAPRVAFAYHAAFGAALFLVLGMLFVVLLHHVTDAGWSTVVRRWAEQFLAALPLLAVLAVPILAASGTLYHWTHDDDLAPAKAAWLNRPFFIARIVFYFAVWIAVARFFRRGSLRLDEAPDAGTSLALRRWSGPALVAYALTAGFGAIDLYMTLDHHWFSTMFGVYCWTHGVLAAFAVLSIMVRRLRQGELKAMLPESCGHDLGRWTFAFACFWAYIAFSQWFLIWYANIPEETVWMLARSEGAWGTVGWLYTAMLFVVPFVVLMPAAAKRSFALGSVSWLILLGHWLGFSWIVLPLVAPVGPGAGLWIDLAALLLVGGLVGTVVRRAFAAHPPYPVHDPRLPEATPAKEGA